MDIGTCFSWRYVVITIGALKIRAERRPSVKHTFSWRYTVVTIGVLKMRAEPRRPSVKTVCWQCECKRVTWYSRNLHMETNRNMRYAKWYPTDWYQTNWYPIDCDWEEIEERWQVDYRREGSFQVWKDFISMTQDLPYYFHKARTNGLLYNEKSNEERTVRHIVIHESFVRDCDSKSLLNSLR